MIPGTRPSWSSRTPSQLGRSCLGAAEDAWLHVVEGTSLSLSVLHRELVKTILMFPLLIVRTLLIVLALLVLAIMSFIAGLGWYALTYACIVLIEPRLGLQRLNG